MTSRVRMAPGHTLPPYEDPRHGERGAVLVLVALGLVALLGAVGLGVDGGRVYEERRHAQLAADHAATAAAFASCSGSSLIDSVTAGEQAAARNGYSGVGVAVLAAGSNEFRATITSSIGGTFSRVLGHDQFTVSTEAVAGGEGCSAGGPGPGAIFSGGECPSGKFGFEVNGSNAEVYGGVHSNGPAKTSGSFNDFDAVGSDDPFTYVGSHDNSGADNYFQSPYPANQGAKAWPTGWAASDITGALTGQPATGTFLRPYYDLADANGLTETTDTLFDDKVTAITKDGVYYTTSEDGMDIGSITWSGIGDRKVTLIATRGPIKISASMAGKTFNPYPDASLTRSGLLVVSNETFGTDDDRCSKYSINVSGQGAAWNGIMWAPGGMIEFSGSDNTAVNGTMISWSTRLSGQFIDVRYNPNLFVNTPLVLLRK